MPTATRKYLKTQTIPLILAQVAKTFFNSSSNWIGLLFAARNKIVKTVWIKNCG